MITYAGIIEKISRLVSLGVRSFADPNIMEHPRFWPGMEVAFGSGTKALISLKRGKKGPLLLLRTI